MFKLTKETKNKIVLEADIFIVPNPSCKVKDNLLEYGREKWKNQWGATNDTVMVEMWASNKKHGGVSNMMSNDWTEEMMNNDGLRDFEKEVSGGEITRLLPHHFPADIMDGLNDGDVFYLETPSNTAIKFTCNQKDYRYQNSGSFNETFKKVTANYNS